MSATLIGLTGRAGCGKNTAAALLIDTAGVNALALAFADPMRNMLQALMGAAGYHNPQARLEERCLKEIVLEPFGCSPRRLMQTLGTEWGRQMIKPTLWVDLMRQRLERERHQWELILITDVRFDDEAQLIHTLGGEVWQIERAADVVAAHSSESGISPLLVSRTIDNTGTLDALRDQLHYALAAHRAATEAHNHG